MTGKIQGTGHNWTPAITKGAFLFLTVVLLGTVIYLVHNVLHAIILGVLLACVLLPVHNRVLKVVTQLSNWRESRRRKAPKSKIKNPVEYAARLDYRNRSIASVLSVVMVFCIIVVPLCFLALSVAHQGVRSIPRVVHWVENDMETQVTTFVSTHRKHPRWGRYILMLESCVESLHSVNEVEAGAGIQEEAKGSEGEVTQDSQENSLELRRLFVKGSLSILHHLRSFASKVLSKAWLTVFNFFLMFFVMYHVFHDGNNLMSYLRSITPLGESEQLMVITRVKEVTRAICYSILGTGTIQGLLAVLVFYLVGMNGYLFWGFMLGVCSIVPFVGTGLIWVPACIFMLMTERTVAAIVILVVCGGIVSNVDSLIRPLLMKRGGNTGMSYLVLFFSLLGGLQTFGLIGIIYGPILVGTCGICLLIFSTQFMKHSEGESNEVRTQNWLHFP